MLVDPKYVLCEVEVHCGVCGAGVEEHCYVAPFKLGPNERDIVVVCRLAFLALCSRVVHRTRFGALEFKHDGFVRPMNTVGIAVVLAEQGHRPVCIVDLEINLVEQVLSHQACTFFDGYRRCTRNEEFSKAITQASDFHIRDDGDFFHLLAGKISHVQARALARIQAKLFHQIASNRAPIGACVESQVGRDATQSHRQTDSQVIFGRKGNRAVTLEGLAVFR